MTKALLYYKIFLVYVAFLLLPSRTFGADNNEFHVGVYGGYMDVLGLGNAGAGVEFVFPSKYSVRYAEYMGRNTVQHWTGKSLSLLYHPMKGSFYFEVGSALARRRNLATSCDLSGSESQPTMPCGEASNQSYSVDGKLAIGNKWKIFNGLTLGGEWQGIYYPLKVTKRTESTYDRDLISADKEALDRELQRREKTPAIFHIYFLIGFEY